MFSPAQLAAWTSARWTTPPADGLPLAGFNTDTRKLRPGEIFVALRTAQRDGHDYLAAARAAGAPAAIVSAPSVDPALAGFPQLVASDPLSAFQAIAREHRLGFGGPVVGITGSAGKTSTKNLLAQLLSAVADGSDVLATEGNLNNHIGVPLTLTRLDPVRHRFAVVEAGISAPGEMAPLAAMIQPDVAVITLIAPAHLEALRDLATVAREKQVLFSTLRPNGLALHFGMSTTQAAGSAFPLPLISHTLNTTTVVIPSISQPFQLPRVTDGMARNAALAIRAALHLGISSGQIQHRLGRWRPASLRGEWRTDAQGRPLYLDCYNANPSSMRDALETFAATATPVTSPRLYIIGSMEELGDDAPRHHADLGHTLAGLLRAGDRVIAIGSHTDNFIQEARRHSASSECTLLDAGNMPLDSAALDLLASHRGPIFIKGSRRHALERLVLPSAHPHP